MEKPQLLHQTSDFLILYKPPGWVVNDAESVRGPTVQRWLYKLSPRLRAGQAITQLSNYQLQGDDKNRQGIVHRLDKETSGVMVVAKTREQLAELQRQFKQRLTKKTYIALVHGKLEPQEGGMALPLGRSRLNRQKFAVRIDGKQAETGWRVRDYLEKNGEVFTLVELFPKTGRTHQLRVHLAHIKHPLVADPVYLAEKKQAVDKQWCPRLFLHARKLCFTYHDEQVCFEVELPEDLEKALGELT